MAKQQLWNATALSAVAGALLLFREATRLRQRNELFGRVVVVTGGGRGLGFAIAAEFARHGCRLALCGRKGEELVHAVGELRRRGAEVYGQACDVSDPDQASGFIERVIDHYGEIDVLVNNAGQCFIAPAADLKADDVEQALRHLFWIQFHPTMAVLPHMRSRRFGRIVNIASIGGKIPVPHLGAYAVGKFAATGFSETLAVELREDNVRVSTITPAPLRNGAALYVHIAGRAEQEFSWFARALTSPLTSIDPRRVARSVVQAAAYGAGERSVTPISWLGIKSFALAPNLMTRLFSLVNHFLPKPSLPGESTTMRRAAEVLASSSDEKLKALAERVEQHADRYHPGSRALTSA